MDKNIIKNQHYISEALLWHFTNSNGKFFEVRLNNKKIYPTNPKNSMCAKFIYEDDNLKVNTVEKYFWQTETKVAPLVKNLIETIDKYKSNEVEFPVIKIAIEDLLSNFVIFYYRSGALLTEFSSINSKDKIPLLSKKILNQDYVNALAITVKNCYKFAIIESDNDFLLSDQFISTASLKIKGQFADISNRHIGVKETLILIPISSNYYAIYWHTDNHFFIKENSINRLDSKEIKMINQTIMDNAYIKCIGTKRENLNDVLSNCNTESPSQVFMGFKSGYTAGAIKKKEVFFYDIDKKAYKFLTFNVNSNLMNYIKANRNSICPCGSGKKFKRCHEDIYERIKIPIQNIMNQSHRKPIYRIPGATTIELPIDQWGGYSKTKI